MFLSEYQDDFIRQVNLAKKGDVPMIPNPYGRMSDNFNLMPSRYTLIFGATGSGKTSFADFTYVLKPLEYIKESIANNKVKDEDLHYEVVYFSLERKKLFKYAKFMSYFLYRDHGYQIPADHLLGWGGPNIGTMSEELYKLVRSYDLEMETLLDHIVLYDGGITKDTLISAVTERALKLGTLYRVENNAVFRTVGKECKLVASKTRTIDTKRGQITVHDITHTNKYGTQKFYLEEGKHKFIPDKTQTYLYVVVDGINLLGSKEVIDEVSTTLANLRDIYGCSPVVVSQQNRDQASSGRSQPGKSLEPKLEDIFKSSQMSFDADLVLALFDPDRYRAYNSKGIYNGYQIVPGPIVQGSMQAPQGNSRFRSCHILKNNFGFDNAVYGMKFLGESNYFELLPKPSEDDKLLDIYQKIANGF